MGNFTLPNFTPVDLTKVDKRFLPYVKGWNITEVYSGNTVTLPDIVPFNYYEVVDKPVTDIVDNEKQLSLWCGWANKTSTGQVIGLYDQEVIINLRIQGKDVLTPPGVVAAEFLKSGGATMNVYFGTKLVTNFTEIGSITMSGNWLCPPKTQMYSYPNGYITIADMSKI